MVTKKFSATLSVCALGAALQISGCTGDERAPFASSSDPACADVDGDGYGRGCGTGDDCDERDRTIHEGCDPCRVPGPGCACATEGALASCTGARARAEDGALTCTRGTLTCRDGQFSACEGEVTYAMPASSLMRFRALIDRDAAPVACDPCDPDCFRVEDPLDVLPSGSADLALVDGGGLTIAPSEVVPVIPPCVVGTPPDSDCDGAPDMYDLDPANPPVNRYGITHDYVFMALPPGRSGTRSVSSNYRTVLRSADVYFYLDMSTDVYDPVDLPSSGLSPDPDGVLEYGPDIDPRRPMGAFKNSLYIALDSGNFLRDPTIDCEDGDGDGAPDNALRTQGVAGNIACLIPDAQFGAGWFRDIPFAGPMQNGTFVAHERTVMFGHERDITPSRSELLTAISQFTTTEVIVAPNDVFYGNLPEGSTQGLWALATGREVYAGWSRTGIPERRGCPGSTWGYPCFRDAAKPLVVHVTDAPIQNGPRMAAGSGLLTGRGCLDAYSTATCNHLDYEERVVAPTNPAEALQVATDARYRPLTTSAESFGTAEPVGELTTKLVTYTSTTIGKSSDIVRTPIVTCTSGGTWSYTEQDSPDMVFGFTVTNPVDVPGSRVPLLISARGSEFDVTLMVVRVNPGTGAPIAGGPCQDDTVAATRIPELTTTLPNGSYAVVAKGYNHLPYSSGRLQLTLGNPALATTARFAAHPWTGVDSVSAALASRDVSVLGVCASLTGDCSTDNPYTQEQGQLLARSTGAVAADGSPVAISVNPYGTPTEIGTAIVAAIQDFISGTTDDVTLRLRQSPDDPAPDFTFRVEAVDITGDGCDAPVDGDGDSVLDTHVACRAGARPGFSVYFANPPAPNDVGLNTAAGRPGGGYAMTLELVGSSGVVLDEIPVYLIPQIDLTAPPPWVYRASASYEQTVYSTGCLANEAPLWRSLAWDATVPAGTQVTWELCLAALEEDLATCTYAPLATLTSGDPCATNADCADGYCDASGFCHFISGHTCATDDDCRDERLAREVDTTNPLAVASEALRAGRCIDGGGGGTCRWGDSLIPVATGVPPTSQGLDFARVRMTMTASGDVLSAPIVNRFDVEYTCAPLR